MSTNHEEEGSGYRVEELVGQTKSAETTEFPFGTGWSRLLEVLLTDVLDDVDRDFGGERTQRGARD